MLVPGGASGLSLKSKFMLMAVWAESLGFVREERRRLRVIRAWGMRKSHSSEGKLGSQEAILAYKLFLNMQIARSALLWRLVYGRTI